MILWMKKTLTYQHFNKIFTISYYHNTFQILTNMMGCITSKKSKSCKTMGKKAESIGKFLEIVLQSGGK